MTPTQLLHEVVQHLAPEPDRIATAHDRAQRLIETLHLRAPAFAVREYRPFGSIARGTALAGFEDIDYLLLLDNATLQAEIPQPTPRKVLPRLAAWVEQARAGIAAMGHLEVRAQRHSVGVTYPKSGLRVDLVPALRRPGQQHFHIPSMDDAGWIETRPQKIQDLIDAAEPRVRNMIRLLKGWRRARGRNRGWYLPGYGLELFILCGPWRDTPPTTPLFDLMHSVFQALDPGDARLRLYLRGEANAPVVLLDPWSGLNLGGANDRDGKNKLIEHARWTLDKLAEVPEASDAVGRRILSDVFVGPRWR